MLSGAAALALVVVSVAASVSVFVPPDVALAAAVDVREKTITGYWQNFDNGATNLRLRDVPDAYGIVAAAFADSVPGGRARSTSRSTRRSRRASAGTPRPT